MTEYVPIMVAAAVFLVVIGCTLLAVSLAQASRRRRVARRLAAGGPGGGGPGGRAEWFIRVSEQGQRFDSLIEDPAETTMLLAQAGWSDPRARALFYAAQLLLPVVILIAAFLLWFALAGRLGALNAGLLLAVVVLGAAVLPRVALRTAAKRRRGRLGAETPLFINLMILLFEAGLSTRQALTTLVQDGARTLPDTATELQPVLRQMEAGGDMTALLREMSNTLAVPELESVLGVLRQVEKYGGEVREPLTDALATIEERRTLEIRERVNVMSGKMTVVLVACFFPAILIFIAGPAVVSIFKALTGLGG